MFDARRSEVKKIINADSNTAVRNEAISASAAMARGLKREYAGPARTLFPILMEKLKDKSASVHAIVLETLEAYRENCFNLMDVAEEINGAHHCYESKLKCCVTIASLAVGDHAC